MATLKAKLADAINDTQDYLVFKGVQTFPNSGVVKIEDEYIAYNGSSPTGLNGLQRGWFDSVAVAHNKDKNVEFQSALHTFTVPNSIELTSPTSLTISDVSFSDIINIKTVVSDNLVLTLPPVSDSTPKLVSISHSGSGTVSIDGTSLPAGKALEYVYDGSAWNLEKDDAGVSSVTASNINSEAATNGQVLTANGTSGATWETPSGATVPGNAGNFLLSNGAGVMVESGDTLTYTGGLNNVLKLSQGPYNGQAAVLTLDSSNYQSVSYVEWTIDGNQRFAIQTGGVYSYPYIPNDHVNMYANVGKIKIGSNGYGETLVINGNSIEVQGVVSIGTPSADASAALDIVSTTQGFLPPRMTSTERDAISSPAAGLMIFNTTTNKLNFHNGSAWREVNDSAV